MLACLPACLLPCSWCVAHCVITAGADDQLTKGAFHFARLKLLRQAAMLVERLRKFAALLPKAEAKLEEQMQLLEVTPAAERPALVSSMREALKALAQRGC